MVVFTLAGITTELTALTLAALAAACEPRVSYEVDVAAVDGGAGVRLGDDVAVIDSSRSPEWHLRAPLRGWRVRELGEGKPPCGSWSRWARSSGRRGRPRPTWRRA